MKRWNAILVLAGLVTLGPACGKQPIEGPTVAVPGGGLVFRGILIEGHVYPSEQFHVADPDRCDALHWHKDRPAVSIGTALPAGNAITCAPGSATRRDPDPSACGFGRVRDLPSSDWSTTQECYTAWRTAEQGAP